MAASDDLLSVIRSGVSSGKYSQPSGGGGGGGGRILGGAAPRDYNSASGGVPGVTSPIDTITGNMGGINDIINSITSSQSGALRNQYPSEYFGVLGTLLGNTQRRASGDISDLLPELQTNAAERALYGGVSGSGAANSKLLRDIGLTRYDVENQALRDLGTIQNEIPTVRPYDPSNIIQQQLEAQERADLYAAAPSPEAAYQRALQQADYGGGGSSKGWRGGGVNFAPVSGGGGSGWRSPGVSGWNTPGIIPVQQGSAMNPFGGSVGLEPAPYGSINYAAGNLPGSYGGEDDFSDILSLWDEPYMAPQTAQNYADYDPWFASMLDVGGGVDFSEGDSFYGGGEDFGFEDYGSDFYDDYY